MITMAPKLASAPRVSAPVSTVWYLSHCQRSSAVLEVVHGGHRCWDEHIIPPRISLLTMPIYFDNQLTVVPLQPPVGQRFIRIDQFWVASCAAVWGQTQAWLAVQSGVVSNARPWLTAHQHAELNSLAKCFPFAPISHSNTTMNACLRWNKTLARSFAHSLVTFPSFTWSDSWEKSRRYSGHTRWHREPQEKDDTYSSEDFKARNHISRH